MGKRFAALACLKIFLRFVTKSEPQSINRYEQQA